MDGCMDDGRLMEGWMDGCVDDGWSMGGKVDRWVDEWMGAGANEGEGVRKSGENGWCSLPCDPHLHRHGPRGSRAASCWLQREAEPRHSRRRGVDIRPPSLERWRGLARTWGR